MNFIRIRDWKTRNILFPFLLNAILMPGKPALMIDIIDLILYPACKLFTTGLIPLPALHPALRL